MKMEYRELGSTGLRVSMLAMGCEGFADDLTSQTKEKFDWLLERGVNFIDLYSPQPDLRARVAAAAAGRRGKIVMQGHFCAVMKDGQYQRTREIGEVKSGFETMLKELCTDYLDIGMIHYVDSLRDWHTIAEGPVMEFARQCKEQGRVHCLGLSSHNPQVGLAAVRSGLIDVLLFSINPCYDMQPAGEDVEQLWADESYARPLSGQDKERRELYELCGAKGVGIDVMKCFGGGDLLDASLSPFGRAFTATQCISYALSQPAVAAVMLGCKTIEQWQQALHYLEATEAERDYSKTMTGMEKFTFDGHCMYCGHCAPCTAGISVASVTKLLNLALAQKRVPETVADHYRLLSHHAGECIECGACETRCPFGVKIIENMHRAKKVLGY